MTAIKSNAVKLRAGLINPSAEDVNTELAAEHTSEPIKNMDDTAVNIELSKKIFGDNPEEISYGLQAFQIAAYVAKKYSFDNTKEYKKPLVRRLPNMPDDLVLKDNF